MRKTTEKQKGFTLIEILVVIGIIAILAAVVIIAINPTKQFAQARNSQRTANVNSVLNAIGQRMADNKGIFAGTFVIGAGTYKCPPILSGSSVLTTNSPDDTTPSGDFGCLIPTYMNALPSDPAGTFASPDTGYDVTVDAAGRVTICAPTAATETSLPSPAAICVTR